MRLLLFAGELDGAIAGGGECFLDETAEVVIGKHLKRGGGGAAF